MRLDYRGHLIELIEGEGWRAELIEADTGTVLPTMVIASPDEGVQTCAARARALIDLYLAQGIHRTRRGGAPDRLAATRQ